MSAQICSKVSEDFSIAGAGTATSPNNVSCGNEVAAAVGGAVLGTLATVDADVLGRVR
jgi:hypothetical protein